MTVTQTARLRARIVDIARSRYGLKRRDLHERMHSNDRKLARELLEELVADGRLFAVDHDQPHLARYFLSESAAHAWIAGGRKERPVIRKSGLVSIHESQPGSGWRTHRAPPKRGKPISNPKVTIGPSRSFDPRYQCDPAEKVEGGFSSLGVGRYLPGDGN